MITWPLCLLKFSLRHKYFTSFLGFYTISKMVEFPDKTAKFYCNWSFSSKCRFRNQSFLFKCHSLNMSLSFKCHFCNRSLSLKCYCCYMSFSFKRHSCNRTFSFKWHLSNMSFSCQSRKNLKTATFLNFDEGRNPHS